MVRQTSIISTVFLFILCVGLYAVSFNIARSAEPIQPTMEQVKFAPEKYESMTAKFFNAKFIPSLYKQTKFGDIVYGIAVDSDQGSFFFSVFSTTQLTFYVSEHLAEIIIATPLRADTFYDCNITCTVEKRIYTSPHSTTPDDPYWACRASKVETLDASGNILAVYSEDDSAPPIIKHTYSLSFSSGWNLFSVPLTLTDASPSAFIKDISDNVRIIWGWDQGEWKAYKPDQEKLSIPLLTAIEPGKGYWIYMNAGQSITISGQWPE